jgi:hypothetical protein
MTEIAPYAPTHVTTAPDPVYATDPTGGRLVAWAEGLAAAHRIGSALCRTAFAPKHFQGKPDEAAAAIMFGDEIGMSPTQALRSVHVISGTPGLSARAMVALVQSKGHEVWTETDTPTKVVVCGRRRGSTHVETSEWTTDRARKAGYTTNKKYETDPQAMLYARAASDVCRKVAADALAGLAYSTEELELEQPAPVTTLRRTNTTDSPAPKRTARRAPAVAAEPDLEPPLLAADDPIPTDDDPQPNPAEPLLTDAQRGKMHALMAEHEIGDRQDRLDYVAGVIGHPVTTSNELTKREASLVIEALTKMEAAS